MRRTSMLGALAMAAAFGAGPALAQSSIVPDRKSPRPTNRPIVRRVRKAGGSLADQPHEHKREIARRLRQAERDARKRRARVEDKFAARYGGTLPEPLFVGLSRRGRPVLL